MHLMPLGDTAKQLTDLLFLGTHLQPPVAKGLSVLQHTPYIISYRVGNERFRVVPSRFRHPFLLGE